MVKSNLIYFLLISLAGSYPLQDDVRDTQMSRTDDGLNTLDKVIATEPRKIGDIARSLDQLTNSYTDLSSRFETYKQTAASMMSTLQGKVDDLERTIANMSNSSPKSKQVGFSASLQTKQEHVSLGTKVKFDKLIYQAGSAYNKKTGIFTVPMDGVYLFSIFCHSSDAKTLVMSVRVDGRSRTVCVSEPAFAGEDDTGGNMFVSHLTAGQQVWVETYEKDDASIYPSFTTFSGVLIQG